MVQLISELFTANGENPNYRVSYVTSVEPTLLDLTEKGKYMV